MKMFRMYFLWFLAFASSSFPPGVKAASLRAQSPERSPSNVVVRNPSDSPADIEEVEEEEEVLDQGAAGSQQPPSSFPAIQKQPLPQQFASTPQQAEPARSSQQPHFSQPTEIAFAAISENQIPGPGPPAAAVTEHVSAAAAQALAPAARSEVAPVVSQITDQSAAPMQALGRVEAITVQQQRGARDASYNPAAHSQRPLPSSAAAADAAPAEATRVRLGLLSTNATMEEAAPPPNWPPMDDSYSQCDPPCKKSRGICNDRVCFCKSPYTGSTCQHKETGLYRAPRAVAIGFSVFSIFLGGVIAKVVFALIESKIEKRLEKYGSEERKTESWAPPSQENKNKK